MIYTTYYDSILGKILLASKDNELIGVWLENQIPNFSSLGFKVIENSDDKTLVSAINWLNRYFKGEQPSYKEIKLNPIGNQFRTAVWNVLCDISYGQIRTYGDIAMEVATRLGKEKMSSQAIGGAIAHNPIAIIIPCHRVIGKNNNLVGYSGGLDKKIKLLNLENIDTSKMKMPNK